MIEAESQLRGWGRSLGMVIPKGIVDRENLKPGDKIQVVLVKKSSTLNTVFGRGKLSRQTDELLREVDEEGWDE